MGRPLLGFGIMSTFFPLSVAENSDPSATEEPGWKLSESFFDPDNHLCSLLTSSARILKELDECDLASPEFFISPVDVRFFTSLL